MNSKCKHGKIKGFTLVELIVVMAIIVILAGIGSLGVTAFVKNSRREAANDYAQLIFTGFQNIVTQCEIKQDSTVLSFDQKTNFNSTLSQVYVYFEAYDGNIQACRVGNVGDDAASTQDSPGFVYGVAYVGTPGGYTKSPSVGSGIDLSKLANSIATTINPTFEGSAFVFIDYKNYEVKSAIYRPMVNGLVEPLDGATCRLVNASYFKANDDWWYNLDQKSEGSGLKTQEGLLNNEGKVFGVYPYANEIS